MFETGVGIRNPLFFIGVVENNVDPRLEGRVQVRAFSVHGTNREVAAYQLPWAICVSGSYDPNTPPPPLNSFVYGVFLDGREAQHPLILGLIPTQFAEVIDPDKNGWGVIPNENGDVLAKGSAPKDFGQPQNSRLARGEDIHETYVIQQEMNRIENIKIAGSEETWSEPAPAYAAAYPYNRVIETANHSIEIDDTPGAERIMVWHRSGSYVQIDSRGTTTHKSISDKFEVNDMNQHVYVGGRSMVYIDGDSYVKVSGNKIEEIEGDLQTIVHGSYMLGVGNQMNLNAGTQIQARGAEVKIEANVSTMALHAKEEIQIEGGQQLNLTSPYILNYAKVDYEIFSNFSMKFTALYNQHFTSSNAYINCTGLFPSPLNGPPGFNVTAPGIQMAAPLGSFTGLFAATALDGVTITGTTMNTTLLNATTVIGTTGSFTSLNAASVNMPIPSGFSGSIPTFTIPSLPAIIFPGTPSLALPTIGAAVCAMPEPPYKSMSIKDYKNYGSIGSTGYISSDDEADPTLTGLGA